MKWSGRGRLVNDGERNATTDGIRILFEGGAVGGLSDGQLLDRFVARREEAVFEAILRRHGPMVWGVCRRVLRDHHDAEDAFQATFLVLARKAASVMPREKVGHWLYGVAYQTAMKARAGRAKRRSRESQGIPLPEPGLAREEHQDDCRQQLDRELTRLPEKYRVPIILCELEGKSHKEAAEQLGWPMGTLSGRLSRARTMLSKRLSRQGASLSAGSLALLLAEDSASAAVPAPLMSSTVKAASLFAAGFSTNGAVSATVVALAQGVLKAMFLGKFKNITAAILAVAFAGILVHIALAEPPAQNGKIRWEYKALKRLDIEKLATTPTGPKTGGDYEGMNARNLTQGLNTLADDGWELVAIEPFHNEHYKQVNTEINFNFLPTYVFKRQK